MKLAVVGTRNPKITYAEFCRIIDTIECETIVSGGAKGIDTFAKEYALEKRISLIECVPNYSKYGKQAPMIRNQAIIDAADMVIAFPSEESKGTYDSIKKAVRSNKPLKIIYI